VKHEVTRALDHGLGQRGSCALGLRGPGREGLSAAGIKGIKTEAHTADARVTGSREKLPEFMTGPEVCGAL
jgi:hypothetical protein